MDKQQVQDLVDGSFGRKALRDDDTGWIPQEIPTREEIERIEAAAAEDDDLDDIPTMSTAHMAPDNDPHCLIDDAPRTVNDDDAIDADPYGWIATATAESPIRTEHVRPSETEHVLVWQHAMIEPHRFDRAVAQVLPNGTLLVTRPGSDVPLKGYAPGVWVTFEHIGERYHTQPVRADNRPHLVQDTQGSLHLIDPHLARDRARAASRPPRTGGRIQMTNYMEQAANVPVDAMTRLLTDPVRRTPPTHELDADDTQTIPVVAVSPTDGEGGGVEGPKARGVREDAEHTDLTPRPGTGDPETPEEKTPGRLKSFWLALRNPDWDDES